jgi:dimethylaniline monooxygenase (N-oxide forming)
LFDGRRVVFEKGGSFEPDLVLLCTGFETQLPFIDEGLRTAGRYLHTFVPEAGASLGFIGFLRPAFGAIPPLAELQARWFALVQCGLRSLPPREQMEESIAYWRAFHRRIFRPVAERLGHLVDFTVFSDELATQVGCKPLARQLRRENRSFRWRFHAGPFVAAQYRLVGPNAKPDQAREIIEGLPVAHPLPQLAYLYMRWTLCRILHRLLGREYAPKLMLE